MKPMAEKQQKPLRSLRLFPLGILDRSMFHVNPLKAKTLDQNNSQTDFRGKRNQCPVLSNQSISVSLYSNF